jgi:hypothetical protein
MEEGFRIRGCPLLGANRSPEETKRFFLDNLSPLAACVHCDSLANLSAALQLAPSPALSIAVGGRGDEPFDEFASLSVINKLYCLALFAPAPAHVSSCEIREGSAADRASLKSVFSEAFAPIAALYSSVSKHFHIALSRFDMFDGNSDESGGGP